jgi:hypothetical protein
MMQTAPRQPWRDFARTAAIVLALVLLTVLYLGLREPPGNPHALPVVSHTFRIDIFSDADTLTARAQRGVPVFKATVGDEITLVASSTQPGSLHVHVYDLDVPLVLGGDATLTFDASMAGAFPIHWHDPQNLMIHLAILEVQPR